MGSHPLGSEAFLLTENEDPAATLPKHSRPATLTVLALVVAVASAPLILRIEAAWVAHWANGWLVVIVGATALKCFSTTRRLRGKVRIAWLFISLAYLSNVLAQLTWAIYETILDISNPIPSPADIGFMIAPLLLMIGIWIYRTSTPTLASALVQLGNTGILAAAIFLSNTIIFQHHLTSLTVPGQRHVLIAYAAIAMTAFVFALFNICFYMHGRRRIVMLPLLIVLGSLAVSDYLSVYEFASHTYNSGSFANIGYFITSSFGYWAAFEQDLAAVDPTRESDLLSIDRTARQWETLLPPFAIAGLVGVTLFHPEGLTPDIAPHAIGASVLFMISIGLRDWWSQRIEVELVEKSETGASLLRQSEQQLLIKNEQLAAANRELSKEVITRKHMQEELRHSQKMEAIGQLTGGIAHDFNNLLAVIVGNIDLLEQSLEPDSPERAYTEEATAAANRGAALTGRLLAFSRKQPLDSRPVFINDLLESMTGLLERTLGETIELRFKLRPNIAPCMIDRLQLENAILNLAINARDAMRNGGSITIETANVSLDEHDAAMIPDADAGDYVLIAVRDTGVGMSAAVRARVFEPFFTTKDVGDGSGLGLSMVYGFVKQSGGHVAIESKMGSGTEVRLYIPWTDLPPDALEDVGADTVPTGQSESVLVVEDDPALRQVIVAFLEQHNYRVASASNGSEALAILNERGPFDLLLSDIILPGDISGPELVKRITSEWPAMKCLLMSGYASDAFEAKTGPPDRANLLQKPFSMGALARKLRSVLDAKEGTDFESD
ncbi:MAG: response regulator [Deltaproteobacteria bacterium]|jgi:signal transduction histidine kinase/ActR/RegA family two-component response regulator|nr:response regulator [Deltaproteobacteria bacterium]